MGSVPGATGPGKGDLLGKSILAGLPGGAGGSGGCGSFGCQGGLAGVGAKVVPPSRAPMGCRGPAPAACVPPGGSVIGAPMGAGAKGGPMPSRVPTPPRPPGMGGGQCG